MPKVKSTKRGKKKPTMVTSEICDKNKCFRMKMKQKDISTEILRLRKVKKPTKEEADILHRLELYKRMGL